MNQGSCYIVGTPIGNLKDISLRALETLKEVDVIACEDTRHTLKLLNAYEIKKPLISYYKFKEKQGAEAIKKLLLEGKNIALVSDAGMPCISDPGAVLVDELKKENFSVTIVPGASAVVTAISLSGIQSKGFCFLGFLPEKQKERSSLLLSYKNIDVPLVLYSAPHDINKDIKTVFATLGDRKIRAIKELTKLFESEYVGAASSLEIEEPRGEFVLIIEPSTEIEEITDEVILEKLSALLKLGFTKRDAVNEVFSSLRIPKDRVYKCSLKL